MSDDLSAYRKEFARIERKIAGEFDAGRRHRVLVACIVAVVLGLLLPQSDTEWSWTVLGTWFGHEATTTVPMRVFVTLAVVFGVVSSTAALCTHRWRLASASMLGSGLASLFGLLGYWSQNGMPVETPHAPGAGMVLAWLGMVALTSQWLPVVLSRSPTDRRPQPVTTPVL